MPGHHVGVPLQGVDRRVKALALTAEGERLRAAFWRDLVEDPAPCGSPGPD